MGYCIEQRDCKFYVVDEEAALAAIKELAGKETMGPGHFSWVDTREFMAADTFEEAMDAWRWETNLYQKYILFNGEKLGDDKLLFDAIAPYVEAGSYIEMQGEDGAIWRWIFDGKTCREVTAKIVFENNNE